jgi:hypothetical protein
MLSWWQGIFTYTWGFALAIVLLGPAQWHGAVILCLLVGLFSWRLIWESKRKRSEKWRSLPRDPSMFPNQSQLARRSPSESPFQLNRNLSRLISELDDVRKPIEHLEHPISGYRAFRLNTSGRKWDVNGKVVASDPYLGPINESFGQWHPGVNVAEHRGTGSYKHMVVNPPLHIKMGWSDNGPCPAPGEHCGFWMLHDLTTAVTKQGWQPDAMWYPVVGLIEGWGRVQEHEDGYRVQYATVVALSMVPYGAGWGEVTSVLFDFAEATLKRICMQFDVPYVQHFTELLNIKRELDGITKKEPS